jgi:hypothetical protein
MLNLDIWKLNPSMTIYIYIYIYIYTEITMGHSLKVMPIRSTKLPVPRLEVM